jgi:hypothetical protein
MKTIRSLMILGALSVALLALSAIGAKAQVVGLPSFSGTFTLPAETHWGAMTLPAGDYTLKYGYSRTSSTLMVEIAGEAKGSPHKLILAGNRSDVSADRDVLSCVREGNILYVRALEMPAIGESTHFRIPHGVEVRSKLRFQAHNASGKTAIAEVRVSVERVPINLNAK